MSVERSPSLTLRVTGGFAALPSFRRNVIAMRFKSRTPSTAFPRRELFRLMSMVMLLAVVGMMMYRTRDPGTWSWLATDVRDDDA